MRKPLQSELAASRQTEFAYLGQRVYLKTSALGLLPQRSLAVSDPDPSLLWGSQAWYERWQSEVDQLRASYARLIGAKPSEILLAPNLAVALQFLFAALAPPIQQVVLADLHVPSLNLPDSMAMPVRHIGSDHVSVPVERYLSALTAPSLVITSRIFPSGIIQRDLGQLIS
jgi:selenocysteine lyase/cysteine desulfurase